MRPIAAALLLLISCAAQPAASNNVVEELRAAGLALTDRGPVEQPFFSVKGRVYEVEGGELQLYTYASEAAAQADASKVSPEAEIPGTMVHWMAPPHFYRRGDTVAIFVGSGDRTLGALERVLGAPYARHK